MSSKQAGYTLAQAGLMVVQLTPLCWSQIFTMWLSELTPFLPALDAGNWAANRVTAVCDRAQQHQAALL